MRRHAICSWLATFAVPTALLAGSVTSISWTPAQLASGESAVSATSGPDGNAWATEQQKGQVLKIAADGSVTRFPLPTGMTPGPITSGPDGNLWFTAVQGSGGGGVSVLGRMTTAGALTTFPYPNPSAFLGTPPSASIAGSSDGFVYAADAPTARIGKINPATGAVSEILIVHAPGDIAALPDGSLVIAEPGSGHFVARLVNGVVTQVNVPGGVIPSGVSACHFGGADGFCVADSHGFQSNFIDLCTLAGSCTAYSIETNQCSAQEIACLGGDCFLALPFCQNVVHVDLTQSTPAANLLSFPAGFNAWDVKILGLDSASPAGRRTLGERVALDGSSPKGVVAVGRDSGSGDFKTFQGKLPLADLVVAVTVERLSSFFSIDVANLGPDPAETVLVSLSSNTTIRSFSGSTFSCHNDSSSGSCTRAQLDAGEVVHLFAQTEGPTGIASCTATVQSTTPDPNLSNNSATSLEKPDELPALGPLPASPPAKRGPG